MLPENNIITDKFICIGENHTGDYAFDFNNKEQLSELAFFIVNNNRVVKLWHEGVNTISSSFRNFEKDLKSLFNVKTVVKSWEAQAPLPKREDAIAGVVLGADVSEYKRMLGKELDGNKTLLEAFVDASKTWNISQLGTSSASFKPQEIEKSLSSMGVDSDVLKEMKKPKSANVTTLNKIFYGSNAMRNKYFSDGTSPATGSEVFKRVDRFNGIRDNHLVNIIKSQGGIFLMGDSHIEEVKKRMNL